MGDRPILTVLQILVPLLTAAGAAIVAWILSASRIRRRVEPRVRKLERDLVEATSRHQEAVERLRPLLANLESRIAGRVEEAMEEGVQAFAVELQSNPALTRLRRRVDESTNEISQAVDMRLEKLDVELTTLRTEVQELAGRLEASLAEGALADVDAEVKRTSRRARKVLRELRVNLSRKVADISLGVQRSREALDAFQWEALRRGRPLPWEEREDAGGSRGRD
jgi:molecular chaperone GrpE (heat shock protein)